MGVKKMWKKYIITDNKIKVVKKETLWLIHLILKCLEDNADGFTIVLPVAENKGIKVDILPLGIVELEREIDNE